VREENLYRLFNPRSVAVVGASNKPDRVGYALIKNIIDAGFKGKVYPVNQKRSRVIGLKAYPSVSSLPEMTDLVLIATPAETVPEILKQCGKAKAGGVIITSSGFKESGIKGKQLDRQLRQIVQKYPIRVVGPNCLGFIRPSMDLNASFASQNPSPGKIAFISQSGALGAAILDWAIRQKIGFSYFISIGEMIDVDFADLIDYLGNDSTVSSILLYMESLTNSRRFLSAARAFASSKPIIVLKAGISPEGAQAALSHTGNLAGDDTVFDAAFQRAGILRVDRLDELFNCANALAVEKMPEGNRLAIVTNAGGAAVIAADTLVERGGCLAKLSASTVKELKKALPSACRCKNPIDLLGDANEVRYREAVHCCLKDHNVDGILVILTPQAMTNPVKIAKNITALPNEQQKTFLAVWMGGDKVSAGIRVLQSRGIPVFSFPEQAVETFIHMYSYYANLKLLYQTPPNIPEEFSPDTLSARKLISRVITGKRFILAEYETKRVLANYGIPVPRGGLARNASEAVNLAKKIGYPVALKISAPAIVHKTEIGGVKLDLISSEAVQSGFLEVINNCRSCFPDTEIQGVLVEAMISKRYELLVGSKKDSLFGPVILFGMGGVAVEVFKDVNVGLPPLNMMLARRLIEGTKIYNLLRGYRGIKGVNLDSVAYLLYKFAYLVMDFPEIKEIDINPFAIDEIGGVVLDAEIVLDQAAIKVGTKPYDHLSISPYPKQYEKMVNLKGGQRVLLRAVKPEDEPLEKELFQTFSDETKRFRFFSIIKEMTHERLTRYTHIDYDREVAIVAEIENHEGKKLVGVGRLIADPYNKDAEFALVVGDPWQGQGLGSMLTDYLIKIARQRRIRKLYAYLLEDNQVMAYILRKRRFEFTREGEMFNVRLVL